MIHVCSRRQSVGCAPLTGDGEAASPEDFTLKLQDSMIPASNFSRSQATDYQILDHGRPELFRRVILVLMVVLTAQKEGAWERTLPGA